MGLTLSTDGQVVIVDAGAGPSSDIKGQLVAVGGRAVTPLDLTPEPDVIETFEVIRQFRAGQDAFVAAMQAPTVTIETQAGSQVVRPLTSRPLSSLPAVFWVQIAVGSIALLIGAWVWAVKPQDWPARLFGLSALSMMFATHSAAVYSTRELALPVELFRTLSALNALGAGGFGAAMIGLFLLYPRPLVKPRWVLIPAVLAGVWWAVWVAEIAPVPTLSQFLIMIEMLLILVILGIQVWATRKDPTQRAVLLWLGLSVALGSGAFVFSNAAPILLGFGPLVNQGYAFITFLVIYVGLALGLRRYRLFEMGEWAFRILFYTGAALAFLALDAGLIWALHLAPVSAVALAMLAIAFVYMPLRDLIWRKTIARRRVPQHTLFEGVLQTAFAATSADRNERWTGLVRGLFEPLEIDPLAQGPAEPEAASDGLSLTLPATADASAMVLRYPFAGRGLFGPVHLKLAQQLMRLMRHADENRDAFEQGAAGERKRIARDLHDDVGARLLSGLHKPDVGQTREVLREAIADMRTIVGGLTGAALPLSAVIAEMRHETGRRLEGAGIELSWPIDDIESDETSLPYRIYKNWGSAHRELISNVIKHSGAAHVTVSLSRKDDAIALIVADDGKGLDGRGIGNGLSNIKKRMAELGGSATYSEGGRGCEVLINIPLSPAALPDLQPSGVHV